MSYLVLLTEPAEADAESIFNWLFGFNAPAAFRFRDAFVAAYTSLSENPNGWPVAEESVHFNRTVRRKLFRSGSASYRLLFMVFEAGELGPDEPAQVRVLRVQHGASRPLGQPEANNNGN